MERRIRVQWVYDPLEHDEAFLKPTLDDIGELFYI